MRTMSTMMRITTTIRSMTMKTLPQPMISSLLRPLRQFQLRMVKMRLRMVESMMMSTVMMTMAMRIMRSLQRINRPLRPNHNKLLVKRLQLCRKRVGERWKMELTRTSMPSLRLLYRSLNRLRNRKRRMLSSASVTPSLQRR